MSDTPYVNDASFNLARKMELKLQSLPPEAGLIFVGVDPEPAPRGVATKFFVRVGVERKFEEGTGIALVKSVLEEEITSGLSITAVVYRGVRGASKHALQGLGSLPS